MEGTSSSSSFSSTDTSLISFHDISARTAGDTVKLLCSYGGRILPRYPDGKLRYVGGYTRLLPIQRSIPFTELQVKLAELCGYGPVSIRCQLPDEELEDTLVSVTSGEDLANLLEEYDLLTMTTVKIRAFLFPAPSRSSRASLPALANAAARPPMHRSVRRVCASNLQNTNPKGPVAEPRGRGRAPHVASYRIPRAHQHLVHHGNHLL